jgi:5'-3' exonuclease
MGIKSNYLKSLRQIAGDDIFKPIHISEFAYDKIAIDTTLYLYKFKAALGDKWISGFLNLIKCLRINLVHPVFVFDGKAPIEKREEQESRKRDREKLENKLDDLTRDVNVYHETGVISENMSKLIPSNTEFDIHIIEEKMSKKSDQVIYVTSADFNTLKDIFAMHTIPFYTAPTEAEKLCSKLCIDGHVKAVLSDDTDVIAYKCPITICKLNSSSGGCYMIKHDELLTAMKLTKDQFLDHCIMCGTDYNKNIPGIGSMSAYKYIVQYKSIEEIARNTNIDISQMEYENVRKLFNDFDTYDIEIIPFCGKPNYKKIEELFHNKKINMNVTYYLSSLENQHIYME